MKCMVTKNIHDREFLVALFPQTDRYEPLAVLGRGGSGVVFLAFDRRECLRIALKTLHRFTSDDVARLKREFRCLAGLADPHVIQLYELASSSDGQCYVTMEYVEGVDFLRYVRGQQEVDSATAKPVGAAPLLDEARLRRALAQVAHGIAALHRAGFLHRDVKPSNVMISADGRARVIDFNLVQSLRVDPLAPGLPQRSAGTPPYMSPEQVDNRPLTTATDWYSFGAMLYEALAGQLPPRPDLALPGHGERYAIFPTTGQQFEHTAPSRRVESQCRAMFPDLRRVPGLPRDLVDLCMSLLSSRPEQRPGNDEILERLGGTDTWGGMWPGPSPTTDLFVGRTRHLAELDRALAAVRGGATVAVAFRGPSGVGKTALLRRFLETLDPTRGALVLAGRCFERESVPYKALDELVEALCHHLRRLPIAEAKVLMPRNCQSLARLFTSFLGVRAFFASGTIRADALDPIEQRRRGFAAFKELLGRVAEQRTLILYLDDMQWDDPDSAHLLEELLRPPDSPPMLLLVSSRDEGSATGFFSRALESLRTGEIKADVRTVALDPLFAEDAKALASALLGAEDLDTQAWATAIARESEGNPYLLKELCRHAASQQQSGRPDWGNLAPTLDEMLRARVQRLRDPACRLLEIVAIAGGPLVQSVAIEAAEVIGDDRYQVLPLLQREHLVRTSGPSNDHQVEPYHDRIREMIARGIPPERLQAAHGRLAAALEKRGCADAQVLAVHYAAAGDRGKAAAFAGVAAAEAAESLAFENAANLYRMALSLQPPNASGSHGLRTRLGDVLANAGRGPEAAEAYLKAGEGADVREALELRRRAAEQLLVSGHVDEGIALISQVLGAVGMRLAKTPRRALLSLVWRRLLVALKPVSIKPRARTIADRDLLQIDVCWSVGRGLATVDVVRANDFQARHLLLAQRLGDPTRLARALAMEIGIAALSGGRKRQRTERLIARAKALAAQVNDPHALGLVAFMEGMAEYLVGRWRAAVGLLEHAEAILRERCTNVSWEIINAQRFAHSALWFLGNLGELAEKLPALLRSAREHGNVHAVSAGGRNAHLLGLVADDPESARLSLAEPISGLSQIGFHLQHYNLLLSRVQIELYVGKAEAAWDALQSQWRPLATSLLMRTQLLRMEAWNLRARCALAVAATGNSDARRLLAIAERDAGKIGRERMAWGEPCAALIRATVAHLRGRTGAARTGLKEAAAGFSRVEMGLCAAAVHHRLGVLTADRALVTDAEAWMRQQRIKNPARMAAMIAPGLYPMEAV